MGKTVTNAVGMTPKAPKMPEAMKPTAADTTAAAEAAAASERKAADTARVKEDETARAVQERNAFASRLRGRAAFLSEAGGEAGWRLGGV